MASLVLSAFLVTLLGVSVVRDYLGQTIERELQIGRQELSARLNRQLRALTDLARAPALFNGSGHEAWRLVGQPLVSAYFAQTELAQTLRVIKSDGTVVGVFRPDGQEFLAPVDLGTGVEDSALPWPDVAQLIQPGDSLGEGLNRAYGRVIKQDLGSFLYQQVSIGGKPSSRSESSLLIQVLIPIESLTAGLPRVSDSLRWALVLRSATGAEQRLMSPVSGLEEQAAWETEGFVEMPLLLEAGHRLFLRLTETQDLSREPTRKLAIFLGLIFLFSGTVSYGASRWAGGMVTRLEDQLSTAERTLGQRSQRLGELMAISPDGYVEIRADGLIGVSNFAFERMTGLSSEFLLGKPIDALSSALTDRLAKLDQPISLEPQAPMNPVSFQTIELQEPWTRVLAYATFPNQEGGGLVVFRDMTREAQTDALRRDFWATAAHELRTPLSSIQGFTEYLLKSADDKTRPHLQTIHRQSVAMTNLVNDLLTLARVESEVGRDYVLQLRPLTPVLRRTVEDFSQADDPRDLILRLEDHLPQVRIDAAKIGQVLNNLLSNAHKYSEPGSPIEISTVVRQDDLGSWVGFRVKDYGIGMSEHEQAQMFRRFYRAHPQGRVPGTGLGMALVKEMVDQHKGRIELVSALGQGTAITVLLPQAKAEKDVS